MPGRRRHQEGNERDRRGQERGGKQRQNGGHSEEERNGRPNNGRPGVYHHHHHHHHNLDKKTVTDNNSSQPPPQRRRRILLVLHGNRQTGQLLLGRLERLRKRVWKEFEMIVVAPDAPFSAAATAATAAGDDKDDDQDDDDGNNRLLLTWWNRVGDDDIGLEESLELLKRQNEQFGDEVVGVLGFSQGARLAHFVGLLHHQHRRSFFPNLRFLILVAGYDAPLPPQIFPFLEVSDPRESIIDSIDSLHVWGEKDTLVTPEDSKAVTRLYQQDRLQTFIHPGSHFVPSKGSDMEIYVDFIAKALCPDYDNDEAFVQENTNNDLSQFSQAVTVAAEAKHLPDEESAALQQEEVMALEAIFPDAIQMQSPAKRVGEGGIDEDVFDFPIIYHVKLIQNDDVIKPHANNITNNNWPVRPVTVQVRYPHNYPLEAIPEFTLLHDNNIYEFPSSRVETLVRVLDETATSELGMPSVLSCLYTAREFLDSEPSSTGPVPPSVATNEPEAMADKTVNDNRETDEDIKIDFANALVKKSSTAEIEIAVQEGLEIAESLLMLKASSKIEDSSCQGPSSPLPSSSQGSGGGSLAAYTMGLVGKPSAGKSTFFNAATAFSRQRGQQERKDDQKDDDDGQEAEWGGASMAAHPFTTIDPNIGYCLVPAPAGSCPEDDIIDHDPSAIVSFGSTHGRDPNGRRFLPVLLKDVAGLVPGAYQGRGRGNQFLNDLTDANVLIHVVDASGTADESGNKTFVNENNDTCSVDGDEYSNPLDDLAWIRNELVEWVFFNLLAKWEVIVRKGKSKLAGMFSGYGQKEATVTQILVAYEGLMQERYNVDRVFDKIPSWTEADVRRLVSLFLGVRFPMALCLNKYDLPSAKSFVREIESSLPIHGAHVGTPLAAKEEMHFVRDHLRKASSVNATSNTKTSPPLGVWKCLSSAIMLQEPLLVFPVSDLSTLAPLPGLNKVAVEDPSLPSKGMIRCITSAGGTPPTCWNSDEQTYVMPFRGGKVKDYARNRPDRLRDVLLMRPGSTVEDVFFTLKRLGGLGGEFVRAEAFSGRSGSKPKPIPKHEKITKQTCVIKVMSNKRTAWQ